MNKKYLVILILFSFQPLSAKDHCNNTNKEQVVINNSGNSQYLPSGMCVTLPENENYIISNEEKEEALFNIQENTNTNIIKEDIKIDQEIIKEEKEKLEVEKEEINNKIESKINKNNTNNNIITILIIMLFILIIGGIKYEKKILIMISFILLFSSTNLKAQSNFDAYKYTSSKQSNGITYELLKSEFNSNGLYLEGWAYIPDVQHYNSIDDITINIMTYESGGKKRFYTPNITNKYNLTTVEEYHGVRFCNENEYFQQTNICNYYYDYVTFNLVIPYTDLIYPNTYELYLYVKSNQTNVKKYTKLYSPGVESTYNKDHFKYDFTSNINESTLKTNSNQVNVRTSPGKNSPLFSWNNYLYYYKKNNLFKLISKSSSSYVTWYNIGFKKTEEILNNKKLVIPGQEHYGFIPSNFVDYIGFGNSKITIKSNSEVAIEDVYIPTLGNNDAKVIVNISSKLVPNGGIANVYMKYNKEVQKKQITLNNSNQQLEFIIKYDEIKKGLPITINIVADNKIFGDNNIDNNTINIKPNYVSNEEKTIDLKKGSSKISFKTISGINQKINNEIIKFYENVDINIEKPIDQIQEYLDEYKMKTNNFYSGGVFTYYFNFNTNDNYPFKENYQNNVNSNLNISCNYIELNNCKENIEIKLEKLNNNYVLPNTYINNNNISLEPFDGHKNELTNRVLYTKFNLNNGKYPFDLKINNIGINRLNLNIKTYFNIDGNLFGKNKRNLFYIRSTNESIPMPNYNSLLWKNYNINKMFEKDSLETKKIKITTAAKDKIREWINKDYQNNSIGNNEEFKILLKELIDNNLIQIKE